MLSIMKIFLYYFIAAGFITVVGIFVSELRPSRREDYLEGMKILSEEAEVPLWWVYTVFTLALFLGGFVFLPYSLVSYVKNKVEVMHDKES